ncbi:PulJ/GspJ family protein [Ferdinandcohnia sp. Marseille-Q9671]
MKLNQKGITLIELLVALAIATVILSSIYGFTTTMLKSSNNTQTDTNLRNESIIITERLNSVFENANLVEDINSSIAGNISFKVIDINRITNRNIEYDVKIKNQALSVDTETISSTRVTITNPQVSEKNNSLYFSFDIVDKSNTSNSKKVNLIYPLEGE